MHLQDSLRYVLRCRKYIMDAQLEAKCGVTKITVGMTVHHKVHGAGIVGEAETGVMGWYTVMVVLGYGMFQEDALG